MIQALLHGKLKRALHGDPFKIEDLLTSVVLGGCEYLPMQQALLPFLGRARACDGQHLGNHLSSRLGRVTSVSYEFWPWWDVEKAGQNEDEKTADEELVVPREDDDEIDRRCQPEVIIKFSRELAPPAWVLVEVKLRSGKSSIPDLRANVNDQLGKYWLALKRETAVANAEPLAVVFLTDHAVCPFEDFQETLQELDQKGARKPGEEVPFYWLSWRHFLESVPETDKDPALLVHIRRLLKNHWQLVNVSMEPWPPWPALQDVWGYSVNWSWPSGCPDGNSWSFR